MNSQEQQSVAVYYNKLKALWDELSSYVVLPTCTCGAMKEFSNIQQQEKLMQFLMGLNDSYGSVRSQILLKDPLPAVNKAYSLMLREEKQCDILSKSSQNGNFAASTFYSQKVRDNPSSNVQRTNYNSKPKRGRPYCDHCQKLGHTKDHCYVLHGFPSTLRANHVQATSVVNSPTIAPPLTLEQYNQLVSLVGSNSNPLQLGNSSTSASTNFAANLASKHFFDSQTWIIDTGATNHMTCSVHNLSNPISTPYLSPVTLPTGESASITHIGDVNLSTSFTLKNVFCVPSFKHNLLCVSALLSTLNCIAIFTPSLCYFQDLSTWRTIGVAKCERELYLF
ncbi:hypothetical protein SLE2022_288130 [Rubroshorea leprosula]